jgi:hypothetical protein
MSDMYEDLDIDPDMQLTISEFVEIDRNAEIAEDVTDDMILNAIQPQTSDSDRNVTSVDNDSFAWRLYFLRITVLIHGCYISVAVRCLRLNCI